MAVIKIKFCSIIIFGLIYSVVSQETQVAIRTSCAKRYGIEYPTLPCAEEYEKRPGKNFKSYERCLKKNGTLTPVSFRCPCVHYYDFKMKDCLTVPGGGEVVYADYNGVCKDNYKGVLVHPTQKQFYYVCKDDGVLVVKCPKLQIFDRKKNYCVVVQDPSTITVYDESNGDIELPPCEGPGRYSIPGHPIYFYMCTLDGDKYFRSVFKCQTGSVYDPVYQSCVQMLEVTTVTTTLGWYLESDPYTPCLSPGKFRSHKDCSLYYVCSAKVDGTFYQTRMSCPSGMLFCLEKMKCRPALEVDCDVLGYNRTDITTNKYKTTTKPILIEDFEPTTIAGKLDDVEITTVANEGLTEGFYEITDNFTTVDEDVTTGDIDYITTELYKKEFEENTSDNAQFTEIEVGTKGIEEQTEELMSSMNDNETTTKMSTVRDLEIENSTKTEENENSEELSTSFITIDKFTTESDQKEETTENEIMSDSSDENMNDEDYMVVIGGLESTTYFMTESEVKYKTTLDDIDRTTPSGNELAQEDDEISRNLDGLNDTDDFHYSTVHSIADEGVTKGEEIFFITDFENEDRYNDISGEDEMSTPTSVTLTKDDVIVSTDDYSVVWTTSIQGLDQGVDDLKNTTEQDSDGTTLATIENEKSSTVQYTMDEDVTKGNEDDLLKDDENEIETEKYKEIESSESETDDNDVFEDKITHSYDSDIVSTTSVTDTDNSEESHTTESAKEDTETTTYVNQCPMEPDLALEYNLICTEEGVFSLNDSCYMYYECIWNDDDELVPGILECPKCLRFNEKVGYCDLPQNVPRCYELYSNPDIRCDAVGNFSIKGVCDQYKECILEDDELFRKVIHTCPEGLNFNNVTKECDGMVKCPFRTEPKCEAIGMFQDAERCNEFYQCSRGNDSLEFTFTRSRCPPGLVFNEKLGACDFPKNVPGCENVFH